MASDRQSSIEVFAGELRQHVREKLIPFWEGLKDRERGGYYGLKDRELALHRDAAKGGILNSRILWFFSNAFLYFKEDSLLEDAAHAYRFLREHLLDQEWGGVYWSVDCDGRPADTTKHTYNQAFAVYGLSSYYAASGDREALSLAESLAELMEERCRDEYGYMEAFDRSWRPAGNEKLSENGVLAEKVYNREEGRLEVFFDREWGSLLDLSSYGHDIEAAWLTDRTLEVLGAEALCEKLAPVTRTLTEHIYRRAYREHSLLNEKEGERLDTDRIWWVQAEAMVGFYNGFEKQEGRTEYLDAVLSIWEYVALAGTFGYEMDVMRLSAEERRIMRGQIALYHKYQELVREGDYYRIASVRENREFDCYLVAAKEGSEALMTYVQEAARSNYHSRRIRLAGLLSKERYVLEETGEEFSGELLMQGGVLIPPLPGDHAARLLHFVRK